MISDRISDDIPPQMKMLKYGYHHSNVLLQFCLKLERCKAHKVVRHPTKSGVINGVKLFQTELCQIIRCRALPKHVHLDAKSSTTKKVSEYDQEIPQSLTADKPMAS